MKRYQLARNILDFIKFESELDDFDKIHETIEKELVFKGTNIWILMFAVIIASVGLNMNSTAVIIGAMLISPLMGPMKAEVIVFRTKGTKLNENDKTKIENWLKVKLSSGRFKVFYEI